MHHTQSNLIEIQKKIKNKIKDLSLPNSNPNIIAVSKTFTEEDIIPLLDYGHNDFGENKVQEAKKKWIQLKRNFKNVKLHMLGKLQTNKVKHAVEIFDYILNRANRSYDNMIKIVKELDTLSLEKKRQLTIPLIKEIL